MNFSIDRLNKYAFTILSQIGTSAVFTYNQQRKANHVDSKIIIKGSTNLKYITPPHLLTDPNYFLSHPKLKAGDLDLLMVMGNSFDEDNVNEEIQQFKNIIISNPAVMQWGINNVGIGILQVESILSEFGYTIVIDDSIDEFPDTDPDDIDASITHSYMLSDILNDSRLMEFYRKNLIKRKVMVIRGVNKRKDNFFIKIQNKESGFMQQLELLELTFLINKRKKQDIIPRLYYPKVEQVTPIYFNSDEWRRTHPGELYQEFLYTLSNSGVNGEAAYLSFAYILHELHRLYNYSFGPYTSEPYYWKRDQTRIRINYVLRLIKENQISKLFTTIDKTFMDATHFNDLKRFLNNEYYDPATKPTGAPFYDFEQDTPLVAPGDLDTMDYDTTVANAQTMFDTLLITPDERQHQDDLKQFNNPISRVGKAMLDYVIKNNYRNEIRSYTASSSTYAASMFGWLYTGNQRFLDKVIDDGNINLSAIKLHSRFVNLFAGLNSADINKSLPASYTLYKGVNLLNCRSTDGSYLRFGELDTSQRNYIYNALPTSASSDPSVASRFVNNECCLLRIRMQRKHKVFIVPDDDSVSSVMDESEYILPPNSVFSVTRVSYVYQKQLGQGTFAQNNLLLVIDCDYMHAEDGDNIVGFYTPQHEIPLDDSYESISGNEISANNAEFEFIPAPASSASAPKTGKQSYSGHKKSHGSKPHQHGSKPKSKKPMSGGRIPMTSYRKLLNLTKKSGSKGKSLSRSKIDSPVTYSVVFIDNLFDGTCCTTNTQKSKSKSKSKMNKSQQKQHAEAHNIIVSAYAHPDAPNNKPLTPEHAARARTIDAEYSKYLAEIKAFVAKYPQYSEMLLETSISRIVDTYESMVHLKSVLAKKSSKKSRSMKSVQVSAQKTKKAGKGTVFRPVIIGGDQQMALATY